MDPAALQLSQNVARLTEVIRAMQVPNSEGSNKYQPNPSVISVAFSKLDIAQETLKGRYRARGLIDELSSNTRIGGILNKILPNRSAPEISVDDMVTAQEEQSRKSVIIEGFSSQALRDLQLNVAGPPPPTDNGGKPPSEPGFLSRLFGGMGVAGGLGLILMLVGAFTGIIWALREFGEDVDWEKIAASGVVLIGLGLAIGVLAYVMGTAVSKIGLGVMQLGIGMALIAASMVGLYFAIQLFASLEWDVILKGIGIMAVFGIGVAMLTSFVRESNAGPVFLGLAAAMLILVGSLWALQYVGWESIGKGVVVMASLIASLVLLDRLIKNPASLIGISMALIALAGALAIVSLSMIMLQSVEWETIGKMAVVVGVMVVALLALGAGAKLVLLGAAAIIAVGLAVAIAIVAIAGSIWVLNKALESSKTFTDLFLTVLDKVVNFIQNVMIAAIKEAASVVTAIGRSITDIIYAVGDSISNVVAAIGETVSAPIKSLLGGVDTLIRSVVASVLQLAGINKQSLLGAADGIVAVAGALAAFGAGGAVAGIMDTIGKFFSGLGGGKSPYEQLLSLADVAEPLGTVAGSISSITGALEQFVKANDTTMSDRRTAVGHVKELIAAATKSDRRGIDNLNLLGQGLRGVFSIFDKYTGSQISSLTRLFQAASNIRDARITLELDDRVRMIDGKIKLDMADTNDILTSIRQVSENLLNQQLDVLKENGIKLDGIIQAIIQKEFKGGNTVVAEASRQESSYIQPDSFRQSYRHQLLQGA